MMHVTPGLTLISTKPITKSDIITLCNRMNAHIAYQNHCHFQPEGITEGGILFKFYNHPQAYKTMRLNLMSGDAEGKWDWISCQSNKQYNSRV